MKSNIKFQKNIANKFHKTEHYESNKYNIKNKEFLEKEVGRLSTSEKMDISNIIKKKGGDKSVKVFHILKKIYKKNIKAAFGIGKKDVINAHLLNIVADIQLLLVAYKKVRKNKKSITLAGPESKEKYDNLEPRQKNLLKEMYRGYKGINMITFRETSKLIKESKYPWGTNKKIYFDNLGKSGAKRLITIPPFMDRVVQEAIKQVLVAIYEPYFDKMNCSFGFRPGRSVHDAIYSLTNYTTQGLDKALEGDITFAYDKLNREKLIEILGKKIQDRKFLELIKDRLNYEFYDSEKAVCITDIEGILQRGTDSPYLWNIYMLEFDNFIMKDMKSLIENINLNTRGPNSEGKRFLNSQRSTLASHRNMIRKILTWTHRQKKQTGNFKDELINLENKYIKDWSITYPIFPKQLKNAKTFFRLYDINNNNEKQIQQDLQRKIKRIMHKMRNMPYLNENKKRLRLAYARYADDWIIITNIKKSLLQKIKEKIKKYLNTDLYATLSDEKTLITDIKVKSAHFLGFEIKTYRSRKIGKCKLRKDKNETKTIKKNIAGKRVFALIDKQRLIDRLHLRGYCDKRGFP